MIKDNRFKAPDRPRGYLLAKGTIETRMYGRFVPDNFLFFVDHGQRYASNVVILSEEEVFFDISSGRHFFVRDGAAVEFNYTYYEKKYALPFISTRYEYKKKGF